LLARPSTSKSVCRVEMQREEGGSRPNSIMPVATKEDVTKTMYGAAIFDVDKMDGDKEPSEASAACAKMRRFIFSSLSIEDRDRLGALVKQLGAEVCSDFDDSVTHLCCGSIIRNVKLMRAVCAGKYVIVPEYIEGSHNAGRWLEESDFEWGSEANISKHTFENSRQEKLAAACHRWRVRVKETSRKAFDGWCVLFYCNQRRLPDLAKIVEDGGGTWRWRDDVTLTPDTVNTFTVALIERSQYWTVLEIDTLIDRGLRCYPLDYLSTYLMETDLNPDKFLHKDYAARLKAKDFVKLLPVMKG
uniref:BRCT domain-containing protein n=1 Tax=Toxocara canis TaxID=6265 RepID=A0A183US81_TOXCA